MIAIFDNETDAIKYSEKIHEYLESNRPGYDATHWADVNKSEVEEKWAVKLPPEQTKKLWVKPMPVSEFEKAVEQITKYPVNWTPKEVIGKPKIISK